MNLIINKIESEWTGFVNVSYKFLEEKEKVYIMEIQLLQILVLRIIFNI